MVEEAIQMHADTLYHRMLAQEAAAADAKAAGRPEPQFAPILPSVSKSTTSQTPAPDNINTTATPPAAAAAASNDGLPPLMPELEKALTPAAQAALRERLKSMTTIERELEERSALMDAETARETGRQVTEVIEQKKKRKEEGKETAGDTISGWFGW